MKKYDSVAQAAAVVFAFTILGKILGFGREAVIASYYGATAETDAFFFARSMPSMIFPAVGCSISFAFTSMYVRYMTESGEKAGDHFASRALLAVTLLGIVLGILGAGIAPWVVPWFAPGFSGTQLSLAVHLTQLTMVVFVLDLLQYVLSAVFNSKKLFAAEHIASFFFNLVILAAIIPLGPGRSTDALMLAFVSGMVVQVMVLLFFCIHHFQGTFHDISPFHDDIKKLLLLTLPIFLGNSAAQLNNIVDKALGSTLSEGAISALSYASNLSVMVTEVFVITLTSVLHPTLTEQATQCRWNDLKETVQASLSILSMFLLPITCITVLDSETIVNAVYGWGSFQQEAVRLTAGVLACYALQFYFSGVGEILRRAFFAVQDTKTPMAASTVGIVCNIVFSIIFVRKIGIAGIALGTVLSALILAVILLIKSYFRFPSVSFRNFFVSTAHQAIASAVLAAVVISFRQHTVIEVSLLRFLADTVVGFTAYFMILLLISKKHIKGYLAFLKKI